MKLSYKIKIFVIHLWFVGSAYSMLFDEKREYIGKVETDEIHANIVIFYTSLIILVIFYMTQISIYIQNQKKK